MSYVFIDESGDLGFNFNKIKTSKYFVVTFLLIDDKKPLEKLVKKTFSNFTKKEKQTHSNVLHAYKEKPKTRQRLLNEFRSKELGTVLTIYLNKNKVYTHLKDEKHILYNYVTNILLDRLCTKKLIPTDDKIYIVASKRETNKFLNENFSSYIKSQANNVHKMDVEIEIVHPSKEKGLQIVDLLCWSIFRKYEHQDDFYYNIIKPDIIEENSLF